MRRRISILPVLVALAISFPLYSQSATPKSHTLSAQQLVTLVAKAETPAEHMRLAHYYDGQAKFYFAQSKEHEDLAAAYKKNPMTSSPKYATGTANHCDYFAQTFKDTGTKMEELSKMHEQMAQDAGKKE